MNRFIPYKQLTEIREASKGGNPQAKNIIDKYMDKNPDFESINRLIDDYYNNKPIPPVPEEPIVGPNSDSAIPEEAQTVEEKAETDIVSQPDPQEIEQNATIDISADLDREMDGLIDDEEFDDISFSDFLGNKRKDANRAKKNHDYFNAFDQAGRESYLASKKDAYGHNFDNRRRKIERGLNDMNGSIDLYSQFVTDMPDDGIEIDMGEASKAYDEFTGDEAVMGAFGRSWDNQDNDAIKNALLPLVQRFGKKNVSAVLNTLREDASAWSKFANGKIDNAISNYGKAMDNLLK